MDTRGFQAKFKADVCRRNISSARGDPSVPEQYGTFQITNEHACHVLPPKTPCGKVRYCTVDCRFIMILTHTTYWYGFRYDTRASNRQSLLYVFVRKPVHYGTVRYIQVRCGIGPFQNNPNSHIVLVRYRTVPVQFLYWVQHSTVPYRSFYDVKDLCKFHHHEAATHTHRTRTTRVLEDTAITGHGGAAG